MRDVLALDFSFMKLDILRDVAVTSRDNGSPKTNTVFRTYHGCPSSHNPHRREMKTREIWDIPMSAVLDGVYVKV